MEIVNPNCASLCNLEVMKHLQKIKDSRKKHKGQLATITYETVQYLEKTPCLKMTPESVAACLKDMKKFNLNKNEMLMLVNSPPSTALEIQLMIEESEERLTEEQVDELLRTINAHFPHVEIQTKQEQNDDDQ